MPTHSLIRAWRNWTSDAAPPYAFSADVNWLQSERSQRATVVMTSWESAHSASDFAAPGDKRLHLGLLPQPYVGNLERASIYLLLLNPGLSASDYYGEHVVPEYRSALLKTIQQKLPATSCPFLFLDSRFGWHSGFRWWNKKFAAVIAQLSSRWGVPFAVARAALATQLASIELLPYHSASFHDADRWLSRLASVQMARDFVHDVVLPRVKRREAIIIVTRKVKAWKLTEQRGVTLYHGGQARSAHLTPHSPGGAAILKHLARRAPRIAEV